VPDISLELSGHDDLLQKHFPGWMKRTTTEEQVLNMVLSSKPEDYRYDDGTGILFHKSDVSLRIARSIISNLPTGARAPVLVRAQHARPWTSRRARCRCSKKTADFPCHPCLRTFLLPISPTGQSRGYVALYRYVPEIDRVFVLAVRGQREAGFVR